MSTSILVFPPPGVLDRIAVSTSLRLLLVVIVGSASSLLTASVLVWPIPVTLNGGDPNFPGLLFWSVVTIAASTHSVRTPRGQVVSVSLAPLIVVCALGGPAAAAVAALIGSTELREVRREIPWYGTLYNHAACVLPAVAAALAFQAVAQGPYESASIAALAGVVVAGGVYFSLNQLLVAAAISLRDGRPMRGLLLADGRAFGLALVGLAPLAWLMAPTRT